MSGKQLIMILPHLRVGERGAWTTRLFQSRNRAQTRAFPRSGLRVNQIVPIHSTHSFGPEKKIRRNGMGSVTFNCSHFRAISARSSVSMLNSSFWETDAVVVNKARAPVSEIKVASNEDSTGGTRDSNWNRRCSMRSRRWKNRTLAELSDGSSPRTTSAGTEYQLRPRCDVA